MGIATAEADGSFRPNDPVTRQDAMVFLLRAMQAVNRSVPNAYDSYLSRFPGWGLRGGLRPHGHGRQAQAGVIQATSRQAQPHRNPEPGGDGVILHRALTL